MKNKKLFALIAGVACLIIVISMMIGSCSKKPEEESYPDNPPVTDTTVDSTLKNETEDQQPAEDEKDEDPLEDQPEEKEPEKDEKEEKPVENKPEPEEDEKEEKPVKHEPEKDEKEEKPAEDEKDEEPEQEEPEQEEPEKEEPAVNNTATTLDYTTKAGIEAILNDPYMIFVNRDNRVSKDFVPSDMVAYDGGYKLNRTCSEALKKLTNAGRKAGYNYILYSGYRSYSSQYNKYYNKIAYWEDQGYSNEKAIELTNQYYAPPGASEHHTGLAADVCIPSIVNKYACLHENYDQTAEFKWFAAHAHEYGFILRYPKGGESITGYNYEPWHFRYVGVEIATDIYNRGITMEEYVADLKAKLASFE